VSGTRPRPTACDAVPSGLGKSIIGDTLRATVRSRRQERRALQRAKKAGGKKERRRRRIATRVKTLEEGQYRLFDILKEIQEWWEAVSVVTVLGQNASVDESGDEIEGMMHEDGGEIEGENISQRLRAERLDCGMLEYGDVDIEGALAAADECGYVEAEAFEVCATWDSAPYMNRAEGGVESVESEKEGSEHLEVVVNAAVENEAMSGVMRIAIASMQTELDSLLRRVQGVEVITHTSMTKFDRKLKEIEVLNSASWTSTLNSIFLKPVQDSDDAGAVKDQPSIDNVIDRKGGDDGEQADNGKDTAVEHADGSLRRALKHFRLSGTADGASRSKGSGGGAEKGGQGRMSSRDAKVEQDDGDDRRAVEHADGADRRALQQDRPSGTADGASRSKGSDGGGKKGGQSGLSGMTDGASRSMGRGGDTKKGGWGKGGYFDGGGKISSKEAKVEHDGGNDRRAHSGWAHSTEPSETTAGASRLMGRGGGKARGFWKGMDYHYFDEAEQADGLRRRGRPTEDTDGASRPKGRSGDKTRGGEKIRGWWGK